jgi:release factor glutamine methyltransferase
MSPNASTTPLSRQSFGEPKLDGVEGALSWARERLAPSRTGALDAQLLLAHVTGRERVWVLAHPDAPLSRSQQGRFVDLIEQRARGVPVAYLRGWIEWHGLRFDITPDVLVPRPETELLLERAVDLAGKNAWIEVADIGTGSGALAVGLARLLPDARVQATDISAPALRVAKRNAAALGVADRITFFLGDLAERLTRKPDLIVANLPYLSDEMMRDLSADVQSEPVAALHGGATGLEPFERLDRQLRMRGWRVPLLLEIDPRLSGPVQSLFAKEAGVDIFRDYAGHDRIAAVLPPAA